MAEDEKQAAAPKHATTTWGLFALEHGLVEVVPDLSGGEAESKVVLTLSGAMMLASLGQCLPEELPRSQRQVVSVATTNAVRALMERYAKEGREPQPRPPLCERQDRPSNIVIARG